MSKASLIDLWRDLLLSDAALVAYLNDRERAVAQYELSDDERRDVLQTNFAAMYRRGVPQELLFQSILLCGLNPRQYLHELQKGLGYNGPGLIEADAVLASSAGNFTPT